MHEWYAILLNWIDRFYCCAQNCSNSYHSSCIRNLQLYYPTVLRLDTVSCLPIRNPDGSLRFDCASPLSHEAFDETRNSLPNRYSSVETNRMKITVGSFIKIRPPLEVEHGVIVARVHRIEEKGVKYDSVDENSFIETWPSASKIRYIVKDIYQNVYTAPGQTSSIHLWDRLRRERFFFEKTPMDYATGMVPDWSLKQELHPLEVSSEIIKRFTV